MRESSSLSWGTIRSSIARRSMIKTNLVQSGKPMILVTGLCSRSTIGSKRIVNCATPNGKEFKGSLMSCRRFAAYEE